MNVIYKGQTALRIKLTTCVDITGALVKKIYYKKPDGTTGNVDAQTDSATGGVIYFDLPAGSTLIDQSGTWQFWAFVTFADNRSARGQSVNVRVME
jgi:hypothetical protein